MFWPRTDILCAFVHVWLLNGVNSRLQHKLVVCGSAGSGKRSLKNNWSMTSWCSVVEKIADVDIITCQVCNVPCSSVFSTIVDTHSLSLTHSHTPVRARTHTRDNRMFTVVFTSLHRNFL